MLNKDGNVGNAPSMTRWPEKFLFLFPVFWIISCHFLSFKSKHEWFYWCAFRSIKSAVAALSKPWVFVLILHSQGSVSSSSPADGPTEAQTGGQTAGGEKGGQGAFVCLCDSRRLTICGLHGTGVVIVAPRNASHRGHLGPLCVTRGAFRQPRHIGGRWVVICSERGVGRLKVTRLMQSELKSHSCTQIWQLGFAFFPRVYAAWHQLHSLWCYLHSIFRRWRVLVFCAGLQTKCSEPKKIGYSVTC